MTEPDFAALRSGVEQHTRLPDFDEVAARGRRRLRRRRLATTLWSIAATIVCLPGLAYIGLVLASNSGRPGVVEIAIANGGNADRDQRRRHVAGADTGTVTARLVAADGVDLAHSYGLIDACRGSACSLQLISLGNRSVDRSGSACSAVTRPTRSRAPGSSRSTRPTSWSAPTSATASDQSPRP